MTTLRKLTRDDVEIEVFAEVDSIPVRGNASAWDEETDRQTEDYILAELESGNEWAWAAVEVRVSWNGLSGSDYLGACSYENKQQFIDAHDYYDDMVDEALDELNAEIARLFDKIKHLIPIYDQIEDLLED